MKRKIYFDYNELKKVIYSLPYPFALLNSAFAPIVANFAFISKTGISDSIDTLVGPDEVNKLYDAQKTHEDISITYRKDALDTYILEIKWIPCVYSGDYYCFCIANKDNQIESQKHYGELALIYRNLNKLHDMNRSFISELDELYLITADTLTDLHIKLDNVKYNFLKLDKIGADIELLTNFMQEIWPLKQEHYNCYTVINNIINEYNTIKGRKKATFKLTTNTENAVFFCDKLYMTKALLNIFTNILQLSSSENTTLHIDINSNLGKTNIEIYSNRLILDEQKINALMNGTDLELYGDQYLGLYIAYSIILRHQGKFKFTSDAENGTRVSISIPFTSEKTLKLRSNPVSPDYSFVSDISQTEFSVLF